VGFSASSGGASDPYTETDQIDHPPRLARPAFRALLAHHRTDQTDQPPSRVTVLRRALVRIVAYMLCSQKRENDRSIEQAAVRFPGL
jgi:hypothetical protein